MNGMIKREETVLISREDGTELSLLMIYPRGEVSAVLQIAHGMCEHKNRYEPFMEFMAERGIACVANDHRGHGKSAASLDDLGYFGKDGGEALIKDLHQITLMAKERWPGRPFVLLGHSMGSLAVRAYLAMYGNEPDALIVSGSPGENKAVGFGNALIAAMKRLRGERHRSKLLASMTVGAFQKEIEKRKQSGSWLSVNADNVAAYFADPFCNYSFTLNGYAALFDLMKRAYHLPAAVKPEMPVHFYSGADDPCAPDAKGFAAALDAMRRAGYINVQGRMFPGLRHEILREIDRETVYETIWREAILPLIA